MRKRIFNEINCEKSLIYITVYGRRHSKLFTNCHISCDTMYLNYNEVEKILKKIILFIILSNLRIKVCLLFFHDFERYFLVILSDRVACPIYNGTLKPFVRLTMNSRFRNNRRNHQKLILFETETLSSTFQGFLGTFVNRACPAF